MILAKAEPTSSERPAEKFKFLFSSPKMVSLSFLFSDFSFEAPRFSVKMCSTPSSVHMFCYAFSCGSKQESSCGIWVFITRSATSLWPYQQKYIGILKRLDVDGVWACFKLLTLRYLPVFAKRRGLLWQRVWWISMSCPHAKNDLHLEQSQRQLLVVEHVKKRQLPVPATSRAESAFFLLALQACAPSRKQAYVLFIKVVVAKLRTRWLFPQKTFTNKRSQTLFCWFWQQPNIEKT